MSPEQMKMLFGVLLLVLGASFAHKAFISIVQGKCWVWTGFLPITVVSPAFVHIPPGKNSLVKEKQGMWVHMVVGPIMLIATLLSLAAGADLVGLPGTESANKVLTLLSKDRGAVIVFDQDNYKFSFPGLARAGGKLKGMFFGPKINERADEKLLPDGSPGSYSDAQQGVQ